MKKDSKEGQQIKKRKTAKGKKSKEWGSEKYSRE